MTKDQVRSTEEALSLEQTLRLALEFVEANHSGGPDAFELIDIIKASLEANEFNPDWDTQAVLVEEIQRMAKRIEELEAQQDKDKSIGFFDWYDNAHWGNEDFKEGCHRAWNAAIKYTAKPTQEAKDEPVVNTDHVICPNCVHQFRAIPQNVQKLMLASGFEPPFTTPPPVAEPHKRPSRSDITWVGLTDDEIEQGCKESWVTEQAFQSAVWWAEAKLKEKNCG